MQPTTPYSWKERDAMRALVRELGFGTLAAATPDGPRVTYAPIVWLDDDTLGLHLARGNALARHLEGAAAVFSALGPDGYISPDWYGLDANQVPTWNYVAVELEGTMRRMDHDMLVAQLDQISAEQENKLDKVPWTRAKMDPARFDKLARAIIGFRLEIGTWRGTIKLGQDKPEAARHAAADGARGSGRPGIAHWMRSL
ncbi:MAG: FMN-binding negative transcriptional regulator [Pseudomonadota bacterium]|nr:FMN-binding negative transcriptional regulator [Pseudomonadota bacterium]